MNPPLSSHTIERRVEFGETDMAGIVHFSHFFRYMEAGEHALWRAAGLSVAPREGPLAGFGWPRVAVHCDFSAPLRFEERFSVCAAVLERRTRSIRFGFLIHRVEGERLLCARGGITAVCVTAHDDGMRAAALPEAVAEAFAPLEAAAAVALGF